MTDDGAAAELSSASTQLAVERTRMAHERTLMAWVRTATSLISFGFTIYKFFQYLRENDGAAQQDRLLDPHKFALLMIGIGLVTLVAATVQHRLSMKVMRKHFPKVSYSLAAVVAAFVSLFGIIAFLAVIFRQ